MNRITFLIKGWLRRHKFCSWQEGTTFIGMAFERYNPFTDEVYVRFSERGYVTCHKYVPRDYYLEKYSKFSY